MLGQFTFRTQKAYCPDGCVSLQLKDGSNILSDDQRLAPATSIFSESLEGIQRTNIGLVFRDRLIHSNQALFHILLKEGDYILADSIRQTIRVVFTWWDAYRFIEEPPPPFDARSIWVAFLRSLGAAIRSATAA
jgi:hypothetical protein